MNFPSKMNVLGVLVSRTDYKGAVNAILSAAREKRSSGITALAVHGVMESSRDRKLCAQLNGFDMITPDGQAVRWAMNILGAKELMERVSGPELMLKVCERAAEEGIPVFLYGSKKDTVKKLNHNLLIKYPRLVVAGIHADRFREAVPEEDAADIDEINNSGARIVFVGRGCPRQEKWIAEHVDKINAVMIGVGAAFDFHAGVVNRAPEFLQKFGLEWLYRLMQEPRRLWKRYLILNPLFIINIALQRSGFKKFAGLAS